MGGTTTRLPALTSQDANRARRVPRSNALMRPVAQASGA